MQYQYSDEFKEKVLLLEEIFPKVGFSMEIIQEMLEWNAPSLGLALAHVVHYTKQNDLPTIEFMAEELHNEWKKVFYNPEYKEWVTNSPYFEMLCQKALENAKGKSI